MKVIDLGFQLGGLGKRLSNLYPYPFVFDGVQCGSFEGFIQSTKFEDQEAQAFMAGLAKYEAYKIGQIGNHWQKSQTLWWKGSPIHRFSSDYGLIIELAYDACFEQNKEFRQALLETGNTLLVHSIGKHDPTLTTMTEREYIYNMYRLRAKAQQL